MEMYANRKGWDIGEVAVDVDYEPAQRGSPTKFHMAVQLPKELPEEQREKLMQIVAKCPVHRTLEGEVMFEENGLADGAACRGAPTSGSSPSEPVAEPVVDGPPQLRGRERGGRAAALARVGQRVRHQRAGQTAPASLGHRGHEPHAAVVAVVE